MVEDPVIHSLAAPVIDSLAWKHQRLVMSVAVHLATSTHSFFLWEALVGRQDHL